MDMTQTLSDLPTDLHRLILSHDEEKIQLKKENEKLKSVAGAKPSERRACGTGCGECDGIGLSGA